MLEKLSHKISSGELSGSTEFPSARELAEEYGVSLRTASVVIRELGQLGVLDTSRGRRAVIHAKSRIAVKAHFTNPIGIIVPHMGLLQGSGWRKWILHHIQKQLLECGHHALWVTEGFDSETLALNYSGFVVVGENLSLERRELLQQTRLPYVEISFRRPRPNTVYIDYRLALDKLCLYLARQKCKKVLFIPSHPDEAPNGLEWFRQTGFLQALQAYNISADLFGELGDSTNLSKGIEKLRATLQGEKIALLLYNYSTVTHLAPLLHEMRQFFGRSDQVVALSHAPQERTAGIHIDLKCPDVVEELLTLLYMQQITGEPQLGRIVYAELVEDAAKQCHSRLFEA